MAGDDFGAPESDAEGSADESSYPDVKATQSRVLAKTLKLDPDQADALVEAICALARDESEPYSGSDKSSGKGSALLIGIGKPRK